MRRQDLLDDMRSTRRNFFTTAVSTPMVVGLSLRISRRDWVLGVASTFALAGCRQESETLHAPARTALRRESQRRIRQAHPPFAPRKLHDTADQLASLHTPAGRPRDGDWLAEHRESGQSFDEYLLSQPTTPTPLRRTIVVMPLGDLTGAAKSIVALTTEYLGLHFGLPMRAVEAQSLDEVPASARRRKFGTTQLRSGWLIERVLEPALPDDAAALIGFTDVDLWPGHGWNFVFGEASLSDRVGVWSMHRYGDPNESERAFHLALLRTIKIAVHETGHMFSLPHCTEFACVQAGVNSLDEADRSPLWLCPQCLPKLAWATSTDPRDHLAKTGAFCRRHGLEREAHFLERSLTTLT